MKKSARLQTTFFNELASKGVQDELGLTIHETLMLCMPPGGSFEEYTREAAVIIDEWITRLRSGTYLQEYGRLRFVDENGIQRDCCLGVLCDVVGLDVNAARPEITPKDCPILPDGDEGDYTVFGRIMGYLGILDCHYFSNRNDADAGKGDNYISVATGGRIEGEWSFAQIADEIQALKEKTLTPRLQPETD